MSLLIHKTSIQLEIREYPFKGRGVCTLEPVKKGEVIEILPVLVIDAPIYKKVKKLPFINHTFVWDKSAPMESGALGFGYASLCNHSEKPNAYIHKDYQKASISLIALEDLLSGDEVLIRYNNTPFAVSA